MYGLLPLEGHQNIGHRSLVCGSAFRSQVLLPFDGALILTTHTAVGILILSGIAFSTYFLVYWMYMPSIFFVEIPVSVKYPPPSGSSFSVSPTPFHNHQHAIQLSDPLAPYGVSEINPPLDPRLLYDVLVSLKLPESPLNIESGSSLFFSFVCDLSRISLITQHRDLYGPGISFRCQFQSIGL